MYLLPGSFELDLYIPLQQRCNFIDRVNFHRQLVGDREHQKASPPHKRAVLLFHLLFTSWQSNMLPGKTWKTQQPSFPLFISNQGYSGESANSLWKWLKSLSKWNPLHIGIILLFYSFCLFYFNFKLWNCVTDVRCLFWCLDNTAHLYTKLSHLGRWCKYAVI